MADESPIEDRIRLAQEAREAGEPVDIAHPGAELSGLYLPGGDLVGANFQESDLTGAELAGAQLARANLKGAILVGANLDGADLTYADLRGADLAGARLDDTVLAGARLEGACLQAVAGSPLSMTAARMDQATVENSQFTMRDIAQMVVRGVDVLEDARVPISLAPPPRTVGPSGAPSLLGLLDPVAPPESGDEAPGSDDPTSSKRVIEVDSFDQPVASVPNWTKILSSYPPPASAADPVILEKIPDSVGEDSIVAQARAAELAAREELTDPDQAPVSQRMFMQLNALMEQAQMEAAPGSLRPEQSQLIALGDDSLFFPEVGDEYLGVTIIEELPKGTTCRCFRARGKDAERFILRLFDPGCEGAALQLSAFQRGVRALNRLHGNKGVAVTQLHAVAVDLTGYVVAEYEEGSLVELLQAPLSLSQSLDAIVSLGQTLRQVHDSGLMVRAWKPSNIFVDRNRLVLGEPDMVHLPTLARYRGDVGGYKAYAAPEELLGRGTRSPSADVFSLGKMLEFLLTGEEPLVPLGSPPLIAQRDNVPQAVVDIVKRATDQNAAHRYASVGDLLADLKAYQQDGDQVVLGALVRPGVENQLATVALSTNPETVDAEQVIADRLRDQESDEDDVASWVRLLEIGLALSGGLGGLLVIALLVLMPRSVGEMQGLAPYLAIALGLSSWAIPPLRGRRVLSRSASWIIASSTIWLLNPLQLAEFTWRLRLVSGSEFEKRAAVESLIRSGDRDMSRLDFNELYFDGSLLDSVDFHASSLLKVNFEGAFLIEANFAHAQIAGANFRGAHLHGAQLSRAVGLEEARCDEYTVLPVDVNCEQGYLRPLVSK